MKYIFLIITVACSLIKVYSQEDKPVNSFTFYLGAQTRITPINLTQIPDYITVPDRNVQEQPDTHLSGPSLVYSLAKDIEKHFEIVFSQTARYDYLYQSLPFNNQNITGYKQKYYRAFISDLYLDLYKKWPAGISEFRLAVGVGLFGLGSDYLLTERFVDTNNQSFYITTKENFMFPAVSATIGWKRNKLLAELKMGYCWNDPTMFNTPFLFPELKLQYNIFSF